MMIGGMSNPLGSGAIAGLVIIWAMFRECIPYKFRGQIQKYCQKMVSLVYPYMEITFQEYPGDGFERCKAFIDIQTYLTANSSKQAKRFRADRVKDSRSVSLSMDDYEEVTDEFNGITLWWTSNKNISTRQSISFYPREEDTRYYKLTFHKRDRDIVIKTYLNHVIDEGKAIAVRKRQRKLYTNNKSEHWYGYKRSIWSHVEFEHPATFDTLAMEPKKKQSIVNDLITFSKAEDYYKKIGKAWKRGYLLYGPPGTGKSSMIAAMANLLEYDVYDLELTTVKDNTELRKLLIDTSSKSIIVIEDIDCSLDLTGQRKKEKEKEKDEKEEEKDPVSKMKKAQEENNKSKVTLSGLLNFIDGLWSSCRSERIIVFTTNYVEKLDQALIRRGRMDKHIELSYCCFEAFKVLAKNYLDVDSHDLFATIGQLLEDTNMTPADVAENLIPKSDEDDEESCLENLIKALKTAKEEARLKAEEEKKLKAEEEEKVAKVEEEKRLKAEKEEKEKEPAVGEVKQNGVMNGAS